MKTKPNEIEHGDVSLIPIMNLVCLLIPFLLFTASFVVYASIDVTSPRIVPNRSDVVPPPPPDNLSLSVIVTDEGFRVASLGGTLPQSCGETTTSGSLHIPLSNQPASCRDSSGYPTASDRRERQTLRLGPPTCAYNFNQLRTCIEEVKANYPTETAINLGGESGIDYDVLIHTMDSVRGTEDEPLLPNVRLSAGLT